MQKQSKFLKLATKIIAERMKGITQHFARDGWKLDYHFIQHDILQALYGDNYLAVVNQIWETVGKKYPIDFTSFESRPFVFESRPFVFKNKGERDRAIQNRETGDGVSTIRSKKPKAKSSDRATRAVYKAKLSKRAGRNRGVPNARGV